MIGWVLEFVALWMVVTPLAFSVHLAVGLFSAGVEDVLQDIEVAHDAIGYSGILLHIYTLGMLPREVR